MNPQSVLGDLVAAASIGAATALKAYGGGYAIKRKGDSALMDHESVFTDADENAQAAVKAYLRRSQPGLFLRGEEDDGGTQPESWAGVWHATIDPIDGTKGFIKKTDNFGTIVALLDPSGTPRAGAMVAPALGEVQFACVGQGAWCNARPIRVDGRTPADGTRIIVSSNHLSKEYMQRALAAFDSPQLLDAESNVVKAARVFTNDADLFFGVPGARTGCWDLTAVAIMAAEGGFVLTDFSGEPLVLNAADPILSKGFILGSPAFHSHALHRLAGYER